MVGYVYRIIAPGSNSVYVGQSIAPLKRCCAHKISTINPALVNFLKKHPDAEIYFWPVLDMDAEEIADEAECRALGFSLLNCAPCGGRPPGWKGKKRPPFSAEWREKMGVVNRGKKRGPHTPKRRANISKSKLGKKTGPCTPERRANISAALKGKKRERRSNRNS